MVSGYSAPPSEARSNARSRSSRMADAGLLLPPEATPTTLSRDMFTPVPPASSRAPSEPASHITNQHLSRVTGMESGSHRSGSHHGSHLGSHRTGATGTGAGGSRAGSARGARSVAASSVRGGRGVFSVVSDEEVIDVDGAPTTLADDDLDLPGAHHPYGAVHDENDPYGGPPPDPLEELEADTPLVRLAEVQGDLQAEAQGGKDPWLMVHLAQLALGHAKVVFRTMPAAMREEPLTLARAHYGLARAYQAHGCDKQASDHGKQALAAIPPDVADTEAAQALRCEVLVMRAEAYLSTASAPEATPEVAAAQARKALAQLVKAAGLQEPVIWEAEEEIEEEDSQGNIVTKIKEVEGSRIDEVKDMGVVALMAQCHGMIAESKMKAALAERQEKHNSLRSADETSSRLERRTDRGDAFYSAEQLERWRMQERAYRDEADHHEAEVSRLAGEAEAAYDAAMYCLNHVIDIEGRRLEEQVGRDQKTEHPTFRALWVRSLDFMAGIGEAYGLQGKAPEQLSMVTEVLSAFAQYGEGGWLPPARRLRALKDKGALLVAKGDHEGAVETYEELGHVVDELYGDDEVRKEVQSAEVLKLKGDVSLASGDFRQAQHLFSQALELYQRHLGVHAGVAQDLLHRIDEVKAYLADSRVMGRLASLPGAGGSGGSGGSGASHSGGGGGRSVHGSISGLGGLGGSTASTPKASASVLRSQSGRSILGGGGAGSVRPGSSLSMASGARASGYGTYGGGQLGAVTELDEEGSAAGSVAMPSLAPGHRLPHLNTISPSGRSRVSASVSGLGADMDE
ncbi:hypothetical protein HYH03_012038 [Edaphochlamys debaryana]|uniref:Uncharacterized protein n=1 Tax=Edaphochlamys debaryana TaxID=47281 RepID=A0A835XTJ0_9CHLO|nr:hypothetical protein HYH03_012038 [Edaphochlamys debaryana]|eukprot:KAG2489397.1 hypothetical protein HYH03_012038 [Edaphochlamys debaryana]